MANAGRKANKTDAKKEGKETNKKPRASVSQLSREHWKEDPDGHDYPAAANYLSLLLESDDVALVVEALRGAAITRRMAKDLLRASRLELLAPDNAHVAQDLEKVRSGDRLSPVLLVRGELSSDVSLTVADGYHRICASYHLDENAEIPCRLVDLLSARGVVRPQSVSSR